MKKAFFYLAALGSILSWACSRMEEDAVLPTPPQAGAELTVRALFADNDATRTVLNSDKTIFWTKDDAINLFYGERNAGKFTADIEEPARLANFNGTLTVATGSAEAGMNARNFWGVYPYNEENTCDGSSITMTLSGQQAAVPGTFADKFNPSVAVAPGLDLAFYNVGAPFYFSVTQNKITSATFRGNKNEDVAGKIRVSMDADGYPVAEVVDGVKSITIKAPAGECFEPGVTYVIILLPQTLTAGYTVTLKSGNAQAECVVSKSAEFKRSKGRSKMNVDEGLEFVSSQPDNVIYYTSTDGKVVTPTAPEAFGAGIVSNTYSGGQGVITFDGTVTKVGGSTFDGCATLASIDIPEEATVIGDYAFYNCSNLTEVTIPESVKSIGYSSFSGCTSLTGIILPDALTSIGNYAFYNCSAFTSVTVPADVTIIRSGTFGDCPKLAKVSLPEGITSIGSSAFVGCTSLTGITIPESVTTIESSAFMNCSALTGVTLPQGLTGIGGKAFYNCRGLVTMAIPNTVTTIGDAAFGACTSIKSFSGRYASSDGLFLVKSGKIVAVALASLQGDITIPSNVTEIAQSAFQSCATITSVTIPAGVTSIGAYAFQNCSGLEYIKVYATTPPTAGSSFFHKTNNALIYVPSASVDTYKAADVWKGYADRIKAI